MAADGNVIGNQIKLIISQFRSDYVVTDMGLPEAGMGNLINSIMAEYFHAPYPACSTVQVAALPKGAPFEVEATLVLE